MKAKFYICEHCGNLVTTIHNAGVPLVCCGEKMKELVPNTVEASGEKHLPVAELSVLFIRNMAYNRLPGLMKKNGWKMRY